jgi:hypothetical protein
MKLRHIKPPHIRRRNFFVVTCIIGFLMVPAAIPFQSPLMLGGGLLIAIISLIGEHMNSDWDFFGNRRHWTVDDDYDLVETERQPDPPPPGYNRRHRF